MIYSRFGVRDSRRWTEVTENTGQDQHGDAETRRHGERMV